MRTFRAMKKALSKSSSTRNPDNEAYLLLPTEALTQSSSQARSTKDKRLTEENSDLESKEKFVSSIGSQVKPIAEQETIQVNSVVSEEPLTES